MVILSFTPAQGSVNPNPKTVILSLTPAQDSVNPNPKKVSDPEFDSHPRQYKS